MLSASSHARLFDVLQDARDRHVLGIRHRTEEIRAEQTTLLKAAAFLQSNRDLFPDGSLPSQPGPDFATRPAAGLLALALSCDLTRPIVR
jgi:hypothetical protein